MNLKLLAAFGDHTPQAGIKDDDTIDQLTFSRCDKYVASADQAGRITVYKIKPSARARSPWDFSLAIKLPAFVPRLDAIRDKMVDPKITGMQWIPRIETNPMLLASNRIIYF